MTQSSGDKFHPQLTNFDTPSLCTARHSMESRSDTNFAASSTCCHTCHQPIPISKSMYGGVSGPDVDTDSPPQYSALENEAKVSQTTSDQEWEFAPSRSRRCEKYWTRTIQRGDETWTQYGISQHATNGKPEFYFTCKNMLREGKKEKDLRECCILIASAMREHREPSFHKCACDFRTWRQRGGSGGCHVSWYHLVTRMFRYIVGGFMKRHDWLCSCGCFDVKSEDSTVSGQYGQ